MKEISIKAELNKRLECGFVDTLRSRESSMYTYPSIKDASLFWWLEEIAGYTPAEEKQKTFQHLKNIQFAYKQIGYAQDRKYEEISRARCRIRIIMREKEENELNLNRLLHCIGSCNNGDKKTLKLLKEFNSLIIRSNANKEAEKEIPNLEKEISNARFEIEKLEKKRRRLYIEWNSLIVTL